MSMKNETETKWADVAHYYSASGIIINHKDAREQPIVFFHGGQTWDGDRIWRLAGTYKPILRHRDDMTEADKTQLALLLYCEDVSQVDDRLRHQAYNAVRDQFGGPNLASWRIGFLVMHYLISKGFDLFWLIESGQAIRKGVTNG